VDRVDVLIVAALPMEFDAAREAGLAAGIAGWRPDDRDPGHPYLLGTLPRAGARPLTVALARPTRMSGRTTGPFAAALARDLRPSCLAMSGVCAGNPAVVQRSDR
jgi:hypothetical protein